MLGYTQSESVYLFSIDPPYDTGCKRGRELAGSAQSQSLTDQTRRPLRQTESRAAKAGRTRADNWPARISVRATGYHLHYGSTEGK